MPIIQSARRINPLDLNKNVKVGVAFPLDEINMFSGTETVKEQVKSNLLNLLLTYPGERVNLPKYGVGLKNLLFEQKIDLETLKLKIQNQIEIYIPGISLQNIRITSSDNILLINIIYIYTLDNTEQSVQLNYNNPTN